MKMRETTTDGWVASLIEQVVFMMMEFKVPDPNFFLNMPCATFDEVTAEVIRIRKNSKPQAGGTQVNSFG